MRPARGLPLRAAMCALLLLPAPYASAARQRRPGPPAAAPEVRLPARVVRLENGLTLVMQPDASMPEVGVEVWTRGGSREEGPGQFGAAHLFEHNLPASGRFFGNAENRALFGRVARGGNAGTEPDFLRFYSQVTPDGLEAALAALADRLESDPARFTEERLRRDQDIVVSELRRSMGTEWDTELRALLHRGTFGAEHPYGHAVSGSERDVRAATVELMREWHRRFAGAANSFVLVAGNFDPAAAEALVRRHFGPIAPGQRAAHAAEWVPPARALREVVEREFAYGTVYLRWPVPGWGTADGDHLRLLARVLALRAQGRAGGSSPLASAASEVELWELAGAFTLKGTFRDAGAAGPAEALLRAELERLLREGPSAQELARARAQSQTEFVRSLQRPAWRGGRTDVLGLGLLFRGDAEHYREQLARARSAAPEDLTRAGRRWLGAPGYVLSVLPRPERKAVGKVDRAAAVRAPEPKPAAAPEVTEATLPNGLRLLVAERRQLPLVHLTLAFEAGTGADGAETAGRARVALDALTRAPVGPDSSALADALAALGARLDTKVDADYAVLSVSALSSQAAGVLGLLAGALTRDVPDAVLLEARQEAVRRLESALKEPMLVRERALACAFAAAGACDPGALDGLGTRASLGRLTPAGLRAFHAERYRPGNAVLVVSGDVSAPESREAAASALARWAPRAAPERRAAPPPALAHGGGFFVVAYPAATQAHLLLARRLPNDSGVDPLLAEVLVRVLRARLMDNLRGGKGWSYEIYPFGVEAGRRGPTLRFNIPLQTDKTAEAVAEIKSEIMRLREGPVSAEALASAKSYAEGDLFTGALSSLELLNARLLESARAGRPAGDYAHAPARLRAFTPGDLTRAARALLDPEQMVWVVAGEPSAVGRELREAGVEGVRVYDPAEARDR